MPQSNPLSIEFLAVPGFASNTVIVSATGENSTPGFVTTLEQSPEEIFPPWARLSNDRPDGNWIQVTKTFETEPLELKTADGQTHVTVRMPDGSRVEVPIGHGPS